MPLEPAPKGYPIKIVRDRTASIVNPSGEPGKLFYGPLPEGESRHRWLARKLGEETVEYLQESGIGDADTGEMSRQAGLGELVQVLQVVQALAAEHGMTFDELVNLAVEDPRGGFFDCVMMYGLHPEYDR